MKHRGCIWGFSWLLGLWLPCGCSSPTSESASQPMAANAAGSPAADPCPALPLPEFCGRDGSPAEPERNPLGTCPQTFSAARDIVCAARGVRPPDAGNAYVGSNSCGGWSITVMSSLRGEAQYHYDAHEVLIGARWHYYTTTGCAATQRYGETCTVEPSNSPPCPIATGS